MYEYCKNCGDRIDPNATVCPSCGAVTDRGRVAARRKVFPLILGIFAFAVAALLVWAMATGQVGLASYLNAVKGSSRMEAANTEEMDKTVIWEENGITIYVVRVGKSSEGRTVKLHIENSTRKDIAISGHNFVVNGIGITGSLYAKVPAEWQAGASLEFDQQTLDDAGITKIATLFPLDTRITDSRTNGVVSDVFFEIRTDVADSYVQEIDERGQILYEEGGVTVICKHVRDGSFGKEMLLLIKNETGHDLAFREKNFKINGQEIGGGQFETVKAGTVTFGSKIFNKNDMQNCGVDEIKDVTFDIEFWDPENYQQMTHADGLQAVFYGYKG